MADEDVQTPEEDHTERDAAARQRLLERCANFQAIAILIRSGEVDIDHELLLGLTADYLEAEALTLAHMEPFAEILNTAIEGNGGPAGYIRFKRNDETGDIAVHTDTSHVADTIVESVTKK